MFRFIHAADPHLDSPLKGLATREGAPVEVLRGATRRAFENLVALALAERVAFIVIAGDLYDGDWKDYSTGLFFQRQMLRLKAADIPVYLIAGNHDAASVITKKLTLPDNVHAFSTRAAESMEVPGYAAIIHGRGFPNRAVPENLAVDYPKAVPGRCNIGLLHTSLNGRPGHDTYAPCSLDDLRAKTYHYWALGHIHQPEVLCEEPWVVFAGNIQGRHANEAGERGCRLITVDNEQHIAAVEWRALDVLRWSQVRVSATGIADEAALLRTISVALEQAVNEADGRLVAARIIITGATALHGSLHQQRERWLAEVTGCAQALGDDALWIERLRIETQPVYDLAALAERDALTRIVIDSLAAESTQAADLPAAIADMLTAFPASAAALRQEVEAELAEGKREALLDDVCAIILEALTTRGGNLA